MSSTTPDRPSPTDATLRADVVIVGGGLGGVAAAIAVCRSGRTAVLTE